MFIVPITLFSCVSRGDAALESTISRVSITVSMAAASTIRRSSACWVPIRTYSVRVSSHVGSPGLTPTMTSTEGSVSSACASRPPQWVESPVMSTRRPLMGSPPGGPAPGDHVDQLVLDPSADPVGDLLHEALVLPRLALHAVRGHRWQEAQPELGRQGGRH